MVCVVLLFIHSKNCRTSSALPFARRHTGRHWSWRGIIDGRQNQTLDSPGSSDRACCDWRVGSGAVACKNYAGPDQSTGIRVGESGPPAFHSRRFRLYFGYGYLLVTVKAAVPAVTL